MLLFFSRPIFACFFFFTISSTPPPSPTGSYGQPPKTKTQCTFMFRSCFFFFMHCKISYQILFQGLGYRQNKLLPSKSRPRTCCCRATGYWLDPVHRTDHIPCPGSTRPPRRPGCQGLAECASRLENTDLITGSSLT